MAFMSAMETGFQILKTTGLAKDHQAVTIADLNAVFSPQILIESFCAAEH